MSSNQKEWKIKWHTIGVYRITNTVTGQIYIGSSQYLPIRLSQHRTDIKNYRCQNELLQKAVIQYGPNAFKIEIIAIFGSIEEARQCEGKLIELMANNPDQIYNIVDTKNQFLR